MLVGLSLSLSLDHPRRHDVAQVATEEDPGAAGAVGRSDSVAAGGTATTTATATTAKVPAAATAAATAG